MMIGIKNQIINSELSICLRITTKLCGANEAQRSLHPNERLVSHYSHVPVTIPAPPIDDATNGFLMPFLNS